MANENISNLSDIMTKIDNNEILLPDFQRDFIWKDEERQKKLVASVLCKMPVGSILLLQANPDDYAANVIGCSSQKEIDTSKINGTVEFLLDGQQRITVLANVFSNVIHENCPKVSELIAPMALKRRFFLSLPKWSKRPDPEEDWFGIGKLSFPMNNPKTELPQFLTAQIYNYIHVETFTAQDKNAYNPAQSLNVELNNFCIAYNGGYLIPLFLLCPTGKNRKVIVYWYNTIISSVARNIKEEIYTEYISCANEKDKDQFIGDIFGENAAEILAAVGKEKDEKFEKELEFRSTIWQSCMSDYLKSCIEDLQMSQIKVLASRRARAIDIYENLNRGGVCLNTFDLIMARVAKVSKKNFHKRIKDKMQEKKVYPADVLPERIKMVLSNRLKKQAYNATISMGSYNSRKNELNFKYVDVFLDVLGICSMVPDFDPDKIKLEYIKKNSILELKPEQINQNCDRVIQAIDRAMFFLQTRCGVRTIQDVNYSLMIVLIATVFFEDKNFDNKKVHDLLEGWYWNILFSGEYDKDQNTNFINNLKNMLKTVRRDKDCSWLDIINKNVFNLTNFSDRELLLMEKAADDRIPKTVMRSFICQYMLSKTYCDMFDKDCTISVFSDTAKELEAHHIIPLGTVKKIGEVTAGLRDNPKHICNSPLNFVWITKKSNNNISDMPLNMYAKQITAAARYALHITAYTENSDVSDLQKVHDILGERLTWLEGDVQATISNCLLEWY